MWKLFKEYIWDFWGGKLFSLITGATTIWSLVLLFNPDIYTKIPPSFRVDTRIWYGIAIAFLLATCFWIIYKSSEYRRQIENKDNIKIVYNEKRYASCRQIQSQVETIRVGYRVRGMGDVEDPVVLPSKLLKLSKRLKPTGIPIMSTPLTPLMKMAKVHHGLTPEYWVNVFRHKIGSPNIEMCYEGFRSPAIALSSGKYELTLVARGTPSQNEVKTLTIIVGKNNSLKIIPSKDIV